ncbi:MAG: dihydroneopterin aldolase [Pseudoruegeria sp.]
MTKDIHLAFAHPAERSAATAGADPRDRISLRDHTVEVEIGAFQAERGTTQRICFNIVVEVLPQNAPVDDDVDKILSYDTLTEAIAFELAAERLNLLETLAQRVADRILLAPQALRVFVRIEKLDRGPGALGVEIVRSRAQVPVQIVDDIAPEDHVAPRIVLMSNTVLQSPHLSSWLDALEAADLPVILCVPLGTATPPQSVPAAVQRRIDLLAIEQNAWVLAGLDGRCVVVDSRTELDWGLKHGQMSLWAPSKMVLDAVDGPNAPPHETAALTAWLSDEMGAAEVMFIDVEETVLTNAPQRYMKLDGFALV